MKRHPNPFAETMRLLMRKYRAKMMAFAEANSTEAGISDEQYQAHFETLVEDDDDYKKLALSGLSHLFVKQFRRVSKDHPSMRQLGLFSTADDVRAHFRNTLVEVGPLPRAGETEDEAEAKALTVAAINVKIAHVQSRKVRSAENLKIVSAAHDDTVEMCDTQISLMQNGADYIESLVSIWEKIEHRESHHE
jgi:hypothetical protein